MPTNYLPQTFNISSVFNAKITIPCQDQYVGEFTNGQFTPKQRINIEYDRDKNGIPIIKNILCDKRIVVILESPHKDEFSLLSNGQWSANGPAFGKTGDLFEDKFESVFSESQSYQNWQLANNATYDVILINSVQFQCSLGKALRKYKNKKERDENWYKCINENCIQDDLFYRIEALKPTILINLCTVGLKNLQSVLSSIISKRINQRILYTSGSHPSTWWRNRYRMIN